MKKNFFKTIMPILLMAAPAFTFTACGDDDDKDDPKDHDDIYTTEYRYEVNFTEDLLQTADVKAYVLSPDGTVSEETITETRNLWVLRGNSIPDKAGVMIEFDSKNNVADGKYTIGYSTATTVICYDDDEVESFKSSSHSVNYTVSSENIAHFYGTCLILAGEVNAKGEAAITDGSSLDFGLNSTINRPPFGRPDF